MEQQDLLSSYRKDLKERILVTSMRAFKERGIRSVAYGRHRNGAWHIQTNNI